MIGRLTLFVEELRAAGIPVSMAESIDAARALEVIDLTDRSGLRTSLAAALVKSARHLPAFDVAFDAYFALVPSRAGPESMPGAGRGGESRAGGGSGGEADLEALVAALLEALASGDADRLRRLAGLAVDRLAGIEAGRPVGGGYYLHRVLHRLGANDLFRRLLDDAGDDGLLARVHRDEHAARMAAFRAALEDEIRRRLVADRGAAAVARTLRRPLDEDLDVVHATRLELARVERAVRPLARRLATRLARRRRAGGHGRLDLRRTVRRSLSTGGVLIDPAFRVPAPSKPEVILLCDVSGSVATFARFTMQLVYAMSNQFSRVRAFAFIDGVDEVTRFFSPGVDFHEAVDRLTVEADLVHFDGHSDYGNVFAEFAGRWAMEVTPRTTLIVTGDARNNFRTARSEVFADLASRARHVFWLNPEPRRFWDTGDSVMGAYAQFCDGVHECRTLRQLELFVEQVALSRPVRQSVKT